MKKIFALIMVAAMIATMLVFTASAAENEWAVYASVGKYKEEYEDESDMPKEPGLRYTENGVQMYSATAAELDAMGSNAWGGLMLKEKVKLSDGFSMTAVIDKYTEANCDKWISFCIWTDPKGTPGDTDHGKGWFSLCRPTATNITLQSFIDTPVNLVASPVINESIYDGVALRLDVKKVDGKLNIFVNDQDMKASNVFNKFEDDMAYVSIVLHQGNRDEIAVTITDVDSNAKPREPGPEVEPGQPCWLWNSDNVKNGKPGTAMTSVVNDDGSLHITFLPDDAAQINLTVKNYLYDAETFPVFAVKFKGIDEIVDSSGLWYCAGEVLAAQEGSSTTLNWADADFESDDGWGIVTLDLTGENLWEGNINCFRFDLANTTGFEDAEFDLAWIGLFRTEKDAYTYAGFGDLYTRLYLSSNDTTAATPEESATEPADTKDAETNGEPNESTPAGTDEGSKAPETTDGGKTTDKPFNPTVLIICIICAIVVIAGIVIAIILGKKKK